jgi:hypothetical protein
MPDVCNDNPIISIKKFVILIIGSDKDIGLLTYAFAQ